MSGTEVARRPPNGTVTVPSDPIVLGKVLAASGFFQDSRDAAQAAVKVMAGQELGFGPVASMTGVYIVKGRVTLSANLMAAAIKRHPAHDYRVRQHTTQLCEVEFGPHPAPGKDAEGNWIPWVGSYGSSEFTIEDAKTAGLAGGENYRKFAKNMLFARALSNGAKWYCPDVFGGGPVYTPDELGANVDGETGEVIEPPSAAPAAKIAAPAASLTKDQEAAVIAVIKAAKMPADWRRMQLIDVGVTDVPEGTPKVNTIRQLTPEQADQYVAICVKAFEDRENAKAAKS